MLRKALVGSISFLFILLIFDRCAYNDLSVKIDCEASTLTINLVSKADVSGCNASDGRLEVTAEGGVAPYEFSINGLDFQANDEFRSLGPGTYIVVVKDQGKCERNVEVTIAATGTDLAANAQSTVDNQCTTDNGTVTVTATGGQSPYQFQIDGKGFSSSNVFSNLKFGQHVVMVKDAAECQTSVSVQVDRGATGISYTNEIKSILDTNCNSAGCHGAGTGTRDWRNANNLKNNANNIKIRTSNKTMPPGNPLPQSEIDKIACWVDDGAPTDN